MKLFTKIQKKETSKLPMTGKVKKGFRYYCMAVLSLTAIFAMSTTAFAASDPLTVVNNLSDFIFGFIRAIGLILLGFGIVQVGLSLKSHDPSQRANGFLTCKRISDTGRRCHYHLRQRNPHFDYGLTFTQTTHRGVPELIFRNTLFLFKEVPF